MWSYSHCAEQGRPVIFPSYSVVFITDLHKKEIKIKETRDQTYWIPQVEQITLDGKQLIIAQKKTVLTHNIIKSIQSTWNPNLLIIASKKSYQLDQNL